MGTQPTRPPGHRSEVFLRPPATAMVWVGEGHPHQAIAVPGVSLADGDVLIAMEMSTICGSDLHTVQGRRRAPTPLVLGHESVGRVIAIGDAGAKAVDGTPLRIGDRVVWSVTISCGNCDRCTRELPQKCRVLGKYGHDRVGAHGDLSGAFASHVQLREGTAIVRVPEALPATMLAPASCATATAWSAVARAGRDRDLAGATVRIHGAGLVGLSAAAIAVEAGATVEVLDPNPARQMCGARFGATALDREPDVVIEASGHAVSAALEGVATGGTVVLVGSVFPADTIPFDAENIVRRLVTVAGIHNYNGNELVAAVAFLAGPGRAYPFDDVIGAVHSLFDIDTAIAEATAPGAPLRIGLLPGA